MTIKWEYAILGFGAFLVIGKYARTVASKELEFLMQTGAIALLILVIFALIGFLVLASAKIRFRIQTWRAEADIMTQSAEVMTITAAMDDQVYIRDRNPKATWTNPAIDPRPVFGLAAPAATIEDREQWFMFKRIQLAQKLSLLAGKEIIDQAQHPLLEGPERPIPEHVDLEPLLSQRKPGIGSLILGVAANDEVIRADARQLFHILVAGSTRWGKSIFLQMFLYQLLHINNVQVYLGDLEENAFVDFGLPFASSREDIENMLEMVWKECQSRKKLFASDEKRSFRTLEQYNAFTGDTLPYIFVFLDEINGLLDKDSPDYSPECRVHLNTLGKRVAKYGVYLIACGQDLRANVMPSGIKNQFISMLQFKAQNGSQARNLIEDSKAHKITVKGRAYALINELGQTIELQVPHIEQETIFALRDRISNGVTPYETSVETDTAEETEIKERPAAIEQEAFDLYSSGESWREITGHLYGEGKFGKWYNLKFLALCKRFGWPICQSDAEHFFIEDAIINDFPKIVRPWD